MMTEGNDCDFGDVETFNQWTKWDSYQFSSFSVKAYFITIPSCQINPGQWCDFGSIRFNPPWLKTDLCPHLRFVNTQVQKWYLRTFYNRVYPKLQLHSEIIATYFKSLVSTDLLKLRDKAPELAIGMSLHPDRSNLIFSQFLSQKWTISYSQLSVLTMEW